MSNAPSFPKAIQRIRARNGLTGEEFAEVLGKTNRQQISVWENRSTNPMLWDDIWTICKALNTTPNKMFEWVDETEDELQNKLLKKFVQLSQSDKLFLVLYTEIMVSRYNQQEIEETLRHMLQAASVESRLAVDQVVQDYLFDPEQVMPE